MADNKQLENMLRNTFVDVAFPSLEAMLLVTGLRVERGGDTVCHGSAGRRTRICSQQAECGQEVELSYGIPKYHPQ